MGSDPTSNPWSWIDPGAFALVGAGAFMSSVTRLTVALAVIMVEISDDVHLLLPVLTGARASVGSLGGGRVRGGDGTQTLLDKVHTGAARHDPGASAFFGTS